MQLIFLLNKENIEFSKHEVLALTKSKKYTLADNLLILDTNFKEYNRLAYTKAIYQFLFQCNKSQLENKIKSYNWNKIYKKNFCVRSEIKEKEFAGLIWNKLKSPRVNLKFPETLIQIFIIKNKAIAAKKIYENELDYSNRIPHKRPAFHPSTLHPKFAKAIVNLTGIKKNQTLLDPFCGTGGILLEAGLMNIKIIGYDIDQMMIRRANLNLKHYRIKNYNLQQKDATKIKKSFDYIATDLPYGKNTKKQDMNLLYTNFLKTLKKILKKRAVIILPKFKKKSLNYRNIIKKHKFKIIQEFEFKLHNTLSRKIFILESQPYFSLI